jgi:hypothetical protein
MRASPKAPSLSSRVLVRFGGVLSLRAQTVAPQRDVTVAAKGKTRMRQGGGRQQKAMLPPTPPVDPENEQFVIFVRAKVLPRWIPFSVVTGGLQANMLVKAMNGSFGKDFYKKSLVNSLGQVNFYLLRCGVCAWCVLVYGRGRGCKKMRLRYIYFCAIVA